MNGDHEREEDAAEVSAGPRAGGLSTRSSTPGFLAQLRSAPDPLSPRQRAVLWCAAVVVALSRLLARSATLWDWDEAQFAMGVREFDVALHHPHPPGFPLYIAAARMVRFLTASDFRALQLVTLIGAIALFPLVAALARELRLSFGTAILAALLFSFFPNVWFYGGTAFSDISATAVAIAACIFLLRGSRSRRDYLVGAFLLGVATGFRTQSLLIGCAPALTATIARFTDPASRTVKGRFRDLALACLIGGSVIAVSYGGAAWASSDPPFGFLNACAGVSKWVRTVDSYLNPERAPLGELWGEFFVRPMRARRIDIVVFVLALIGIGASVVRRNAGVLLALLTFVPFIALSWLMLDRWSVARYSVAYVALHALLAAEGAGAVGRMFARWRHGLPAVLQAVMMIAVTTDYVVWTLPALREVRSAAPTEAAMLWIESHTGNGARVLAAENMAPFAIGDLTSRRLSLLDPQHPPLVPDAESVWCVTEGRTLSPRARNFVRPRGRIWELVRQRYFEVSVLPASDLGVFASGWYGPEDDQVSAWRWMGRRGVILLQPIEGRARLTLALSPPSELIGLATMQIRFNGVVADRLLISRESVNRVIDVTPKPGAFNEVEITTDRIINPQQEHILDDARDLGLQLHSLTWSAIPR